MGFLRETDEWILILLFIQCKNGKMLFTLKPFGVKESFDLNII